MQANASLVFALLAAGHLAEEASREPHRVEDWDHAALLLLSAFVADRYT